MSPVDMAWLRADRPESLFMIVAVWIFDAPIDPDALAARLADRLLRHDRFRQKIVEATTGYAWVDDDDFDMARHLVRVRLHAPAGEAELKRLAGELASKPLDRAHPMWEFQLVENYGDTHALVMRVHHCLGDGVALVGVIQSITDDAASVDRGHRARPGGHGDDGHDDEGGFADALLRPLTRTAAWAARAAGGALATSIDLAASADARAAFANAGMRVVDDALKIALMRQDSWTPLKGEPRGRKSVAWNDPLPLAEVKAVARVLGVSVNDVLLSCATGALRRYLEAIDEPTAGKELRAMVPVNLRRADDPPSLGNRFGLVPLLLPVGVANPVERVYAVRARMDALKAGYQGPLAYALLNAVGMTPRLVQRGVLDYLAGKATAVITNVQGPAAPLRLVGRTVTRAMFWVPQSGTVGLGISVLSYAGGVQFGLVADTALCPAPQLVADEFTPEFDRLLIALSMLPRELVRTGVDAAEMERRVFGADDAARAPSGVAPGRRGAPASRRPARGPRAGLRAAAAEGAGAPARTRAPGSSPAGGKASKKAAARPAARAAGARRARRTAGATE